MPVNSWAQVAVVKGEGGLNLNFYVNGDLVYTDIMDSLAVNVDGVLTIGGRTISAVSSFNGTIDEVMIFDKALTGNEVKWLYEQDLSLL
ncbi:MAG: LamG domain-containing protein [Candidatus Pacearchaeota archaeon]|nr:LamG domain-containing protein [Candidatus Pacearchaeota archaeon]